MILALAAFAMTPASTQEGIPANEFPELVRIDCLEGSGSGFMVGPNVGLSANHVTSLHGCFINNKPFKVLSHVGDFSVFEISEPVDKWFRIDCDGFVAHRRYEAIGFARGLDSLTEVDITATGNSAHVQPTGGTDDVLSILQGVFNVIPGQSGGVMLDKDTHAAVGIVNTFDAEDGLSGSVELKNTGICKGVTS